MTAAPPSGAGGFEEHLDRWGTHSAKWDLLAARLGPEAVSMSIADMELRTAPCVIDAVTAAARHGTYGYTESSTDFEAGRRPLAARAARLGARARLRPLLPARRPVRERPAQCRPSRPPRRPARRRHPRPGLRAAPRGRRAVRCRDPPRPPPPGRLPPHRPARIDIPALERALDGADLFLLCNPHNPHRPHLDGRGAGRRRRCGPAHRRPRALR